MRPTTNAALTRALPLRPVASRIRLPVVESRPLTSRGAYLYDGLEACQAPAEGLASTLESRHGRLKGSCRLLAGLRHAPSSALASAS